MSGNIDAPEGGLDAIMQAIVCDVCEFKPKKNFETEIRIYNKYDNLATTDTCRRRAAIRNRKGDARRQGDDRSVACYLDVQLDDYHL